MKQYRAYARELEKTAQLHTQPLPTPEALATYLDGEASQRLRESVPLNDRRASGAFFTSSTLRSFALDRLDGTLDRDSVIFDPACGAADLLLGAAAFLPLGNDWVSTLKLWGTQLLGHDLHPEFLQAARARLKLAAWQRHAEDPVAPGLARGQPFPALQRRSGLELCEAYGNATHVLLNPPFTPRATEEDCAWAAGRVNAASLFLEQALHQAPAGCRIIAILPEVIRCGSRYERLRRLVEGSAILQAVEPYGQFDNYTDVDVFVLDVRKTQGPRSLTERTAWFGSEVSNATVQDHFSISVGSVVDYRDPHTGEELAYLTARNTKPWSQLDGVVKRRRHSGKPCVGPFVVVKRTSRAAQGHRAVATLLNQGPHYAVDNHLIVCRPKDGSLTRCQDLLKVLRSEVTDAWLDETMRCRHLTVQSVRNIPWSL